MSLGGIAPLPLKSAYTTPYQMGQLNILCKHSRDSKVSEKQGKPVSQRLCDFSLLYRNTPHSTTNEMYAFPEATAQDTHLDLIHPNVQLAVESKQAQQKKVMM